MPFGSTFQLSSLNGANGFRLDGSSFADYAGAAVSSAGDVNGDGYADMIVGAPGANPGYLMDCGSAYVIFGSAAGFPATIALSSIASSLGFRIDALDMGDYLGSSVAAAGDVNGDGLDDIIVGAPYAGAAPASGGAYVIFGAATGLSGNIDLATLDGTNGFRLDGPASPDGFSNLTGVSVASAGDLNGDGIADLIVGAAGMNGNHEDSGETYVVFGTSSGFSPSLDLSALNGTNGFRILGAGGDDYSGYSVASAGDVNGDGRDDIIIGSTQGFSWIPSTASIVFGQAGGFAAELDLADLDGTNGFNLTIQTYSSSISVASAGDINGDGIGDFIVGQGTGSAYIVFGKSSGWDANLDWTALDGTNGFRIYGEFYHTSLGESVASAGDINGDGYDDLIVGDPFADLYSETSGYSRSGAAYVLFGKASGFSASIGVATLDGINGFRIDAVDSVDYLGASVASAGDINDDGFDDLIIGAPNASSGIYHPTMQGGGAAFVVYGMAQGAIARTGTSGDDLLRSGEFNDSLSGGDGEDVIIARQGADTLIGGLGDDTLNGGTGANVIDGGDGADLAILDYSDQSGGVVFSIDQPAALFAVTSGGGAFGSIVNIERANVLGGGGADSLTGGASGDTLMGGGGDDTLTGGAGDDLLDGGAGLNTLIGGAGDDTYVLFSLNDTVVELANEGVDTIHTDSGLLDLSDFENVENLTFTGSGMHTGGGNELANIITGGSGADDLHGGLDSVADTLIGGAGDDSYSVLENDVIVEASGGGVDTVFTALSSYVLPDNVENLTYEGASGSFNGGGNALNNLIRGGDYGSTLDGGAGDDDLRGGLQADVLTGGDGDDSLLGGSSADTLEGGAGDDELNGGWGADTAMFSGARADYDISLLPSGNYAIADLRSGAPEGRDALIDIEHVQFSDQAITLTVAPVSVSADFTVAAGEIYAGYSAFYLGGASGYTFRNDGTITGIGNPSGGGSAILSQNFNVRIENNGLIELDLSAAGGRAVGDSFDELINTGTIKADGVDDVTSAIYTGYLVTLTNSSTGVLSAGAVSGHAIGVNFFNWAQVQNAGSITANSTSGDATGIHFGRFEHGYFENTGSVMAIAGAGGLSIGVDAESMIERAVSAPNIVNSGTITGSIAIRGGAGVEYVVNSGTLDGGVDLGGANDRLINTGAIDGDVMMGGGDDSLDNSGGTIDGRIYLNAGNDRFWGGAGNETISGGAGSDTLAGGAGDDTYIVDNVGDLVTETSAAHGNDWVQSSVNWTLSANIERLTLTGAANLAGTGNELGNRIEGNAGGNTLRGNAGADTLDGGLGADTLNGGGGDDVFIVDNTGDVATEQFAVHGYDQVQSSVSWTLGAYIERLTLTGAADLSGTGNGEANLIEGNSGRNTLDGGAGADTMIGGAGGDTYYVDNTGDLTIEALNEGSDRVFSSVNRTLSANIENLTLSGAANIAGVGNALANVITGNSGDNTLNGALGADTLTGGAGRDNFLFNTALGGGNVDRITDFNIVDDTIMLENGIFTALAATGALNAANFRKGTGAADANDFIIYQASTGALFYDADGNGSGAQVQIATLTSGLALTNADFFVC